MRNVKKIFVLFLAVSLMATFVPLVSAQDGGKININQASVEELCQLKGIGSSYAERIVNYRQKNGPFERPEDIVNVKGIGSKTFEDNKDRICVK